MCSLNFEILIQWKNSAKVCFASSKAVEVELCKIMKEDSKCALEAECCFSKMEPLINPSFYELKATSVGEIIFYQHESKHNGTSLLRNIFFCIVHYWLIEPFHIIKK